ncbi:MAG: glycosyltransferase family 39 protein, partial [Anaerolineales bacterium]|nr:glycosyltransferase family 39 protein [Anaerolineales bacterium]
MLARWRAQSPRQRLLLTTVVLLLLALGLRLARLGAESAWIDEAYSIVLARHSLVDLIRGTVADQHPPLYYLLLKGWLEIANITGLSSLFPMGESGAAQPVGAIVVYARLLSVLIGVVHVGQVLALGRKLGGEWLGLGAGLLVALSPLHVYYSQEVRQYILLAALTTAATAELWKCLQGGGRWWLYALFAALALYTQYFAVFIFIAHALILFWYGLRRAAFGSKFGGEITTRKLLLGWLGAMLGVGLAFLPWLRIAIVQTLYHTMAWIDEPTAGSLRDVPLRLVLGSGVMVLPDILRWIGLAGLTCLIGWGAWQAKRQSPAVREAYGFIAAWALVPLGVIMAVAILYPVFQLKQFLIVLVPWLMLVVAAIGGLPAWAIRMRGKQRLIPLSRLAYLAVFLTALPTLAYQVVTLEKDDWRGATAYLAEQACPGD